MDRDDRILDFIQGKLPAEESAAFETEMAQSPDLAAEVAALKATRALFAEDDAAVAPDWDSFAARLDREAPTPANEQVPANDNRPIRFSLWQTGGLIAASLALWQFAAVPQLSGPDQPLYDPVSEVIAVPTLQILFVGGADIDAVSAVLRDTGGTIVDGPSALGLYRVGFEQTSDRDAALSILEGRTDLISSVTAD